MARPAQQSDLNQIKTATAVLVTCIVQTLNESDHTYQELFLARLGKAYDELRDDPAHGGLHALETISWVRELLTGWSFVTGQGKPFLED